MAKRTKDGVAVEFNDVREMLRKEIEKKYGGISKFLNSEKGKEFGGMKIKIYLYNTGPVNYEIVNKLCRFFGIGELTRKIVVTRSVSYRLNKSIPKGE